MTYTLPLLHKYRFIIALLLTAFVSTSMIAFKMASPAYAQATADTSQHVSNYIVPVLDENSPVTSAASNGSLTPDSITSTGKISFERPKVTTIPAPKKEEPVVKKTEDSKPDSTPASTAPPADAAVAAPNVADTATAGPAVTAKPQTQAQAAAPAAPIASPANNNNAAPAPVAAAPIAGTSPAAAQAFARTYLASKGMGDSEFQCLVTLWNHESGWNFQATNSSSGAYGIPQSLPGSKMASAGADWQTNPQTQIIWGVSYITGRYGTPCGAMSIWNTRGWY